MKIRTLTEADKLLLRVALLNAGIKARVAKINNGLRVVFAGDWQAVAAVLNEEGFVYAGGSSFDRFQFSGDQTFIRGVRV